nr:Retrovirus-related Pol polyprotein from transposon TNT 1-94 [Ipomoea batatas]
MGLGNAVLSLGFTVFGSGTNIKFHIPNFCLGISIALLLNGFQELLGAVFGWSGSATTNSNNGDNSGFVLVSTFDGCNSGRVVVPVDPTYSNNGFVLAFDPTNSNNGGNHGRVHVSVDPINSNNGSNSGPVLVSGDPTNSNNGRNGVLVPVDSTFDTNSSHGGNNGGVLADVDPKVAGVLILTPSDLNVQASRHSFPVSRRHSVPLKEQLHNIQKGGDSMQKYLDSIVKIVVALDRAKSAIPEQDVILYVLRGLVFEYSSIKQNIRTNIVAVTFARVSSWLLTEELTLQMEQRIQLRGQPNRGRGPPRDSIICQICGKYNHATWDCWHRFDSEYSGSSISTPQAFYASQSANSNENWFLDTGANAHVTPDLSRFYSHTPYSGTETVTSAGVHPLPIAHVGSGSSGEGGGLAGWMGEASGRWVGLANWVSGGGELGGGEWMDCGLGPDEMVGKCGKMGRTPKYEEDGANAHVTPDLSRFYSHTPYSGTETVTSAGVHPLSIAHVGSDASRAQAAISSNTSMVRHSQAAVGPILLLYSPGRLPSHSHHSCLKSQIVTESPNLPQKYSLVELGFSPQRGLLLDSNSWVDSSCLCGRLTSKSHTSQVDLG